MQRLHAFDLVDRIAALEDPGRLGLRGQPTNAEEAARGRSRDKDATRGWPGEQQAKRFILLLEEMLRSQAGIHVRAPSHHAAPFRSTPFALDVGPVAFDLDAAGSALKIDLLDSAGATIAAGGLPTTFLPFTGSGSEGVPERHRAVLSYVSVAHSQLAGAAVVTLSSAVLGTRFTVRRNGDPIPSLTSRMPTWWYESQQIAAAQSDVPFPPQMTTPQNLLYAPINLVAGDTISAEFELPATNAALADLDSLVWVKLGGWIYPVRKDDPSISGTLAD